MCAIVVDVEQRRFSPRQLAGEEDFATDLGVSFVGPCMELLARIPDESLDLVVTSPPYDGQPKYGNGEAYDRAWFVEQFLAVTQELKRVLRPTGSFILNYRSKRNAGERGVLQYELVLWLRDQGWNFCEDFIWGKPSPPPGRWNRHLKDAVEYCFQFSKSKEWAFYPEQALKPARWDRKDVERRKRLAHNYVRVNEPSGHGRHRINAGPDMVRPSTLLTFEPEFEPNPTEHPARFPVALPSFFIELCTRPGDVVFDPFGGTGTTGLAAEILGRQWLLSELDGHYAGILPSRILKAGQRRLC